MKKYCVLGDDNRSNYIRKMYIEDGVELVSYDEADFVITPIPFSKDSIKVFGSIIDVDEFILNVKDKIVFTGALSKDIEKKFEGIKYIDLMKMDEVAVLNAIATSEGAIYEAIKNSDITLHGSNVLVMGYGRIGKVLSNMLKGMGAKVFCEARNKKDIAFIEAMGYNSIYIDELNSFLPKMDYIFNTIPVKILDESNIKYINSNCTIVDLASAPGGVDFEYANKKNLNVTWALALPSKVAPKSAAIYLKNTIDKLIGEIDIDC